MLACRQHRFQLPKWIRDEVWEHYRPGQEIDKNPSNEYLQIMHQCIQWWERQGP